MPTSTIALFLLASIWFVPATAFAQSTGLLLGRTHEQWRAELKSESAPQRHLAAWALAHAPNSPVAAVELLGHHDPVVRYWGVQATGQGQRPAKEIADRLAPLLGDESRSVRVAAAEACVRLGRTDEGLKALSEALSDPQEAVRIQAISTLERLGMKAAPLKEQIEKATADSSEYVKRISTRLLAQIGRDE